MIGRVQWGHPKTQKIKEYREILERQFKSEVQQVLMMTARILHSECDSQAIFLVDY
jgi:hypothetical protein